MIILKSAQEVAVMRVAGSIVGTILDELGRMVHPGVTTLELNHKAEQLTEKYHAVPAFKGYNGFPASLCASVNEEVVHGIPGNRTLKKGDIIGMDFGVVYRNYYADAAITVGVGEIAPVIKNLLDVTRESLYKGIEKAFSGNRLYDISAAVQNHVESHGFSVVRDFVGHGVGRQMHESPQIPNYVGNEYNPRLKPGMTLAIEPMVNQGTYLVEVDNYDHWTVRTADGKYSAHFEHTVAIGTQGPEILTLARPELLPEVG
jgi:methionyl aminopeptidase